MESFTERPVSLPGLRMVHGTTTSLHTGLKEHWGIGRVALRTSRGEQPDPSRPVRRALTFLRERFEESISLEELATHVNLDKFHLCRAFRAQVGMPPHAYLTHLRVARAKELLTRGVRPSELAPLVGFYDQPQLTRHFRRLVGTTPAQYVKAPHDPRFRGVFRSPVRQ